MTIAALRALLDQELPHVRRPPAPHLNLPPWTAKEPPMEDETERAPAPPPEPPRLWLRAITESESLEEAINWATLHDDPDVRQLGDAAKAAVSALYERHDHEAELATITAELADVEARAAELRARQAQLQPATAKRRPPTYNAAIVRAWARSEGVTVPATGRVPVTVVEAWRTATGQA